MSSAGGSQNDVEVRISGTVDASLAASTATASAQMDKVAASVLGVNAAMQAAAAETAAAMNLLAMESAPALAEAEMLGDANIGLIPSATGAAAALEAEAVAAGHAAVANAGVTREVIVLAHEMVQGRFSRIPGSLMVLAERMGGVSLATWGVVGVVAIAAAGLGYMAYEAYEASARLEELTAREILLGHSAQGAAGFLEEQRDLMTALPGVTKKIADEVLELEASNQSLSDVIKNQISQVLPVFVEAYGDDAPKAIKQMIDAASDLSLNGLQKLNKDTLHLTETQYANISALVETGQASQALQAILDILATRGKVSIESLQDQLKELQADQVKMKIGAEQMLAAGSDPAAWALYQMQVDALERKIEGLTAAINAARNAQKELLAAVYKGDQTTDADVTKPPKKHPFAGTGFSNAGAAAIAEARETIGIIDSYQEEDAITRLARERTVWAALLAGDKLNAAQRSEIKREISRVDAAMARQVIKDTEDAAREQKAIAEAQLAEFIRSDEDRLREGLKGIDDEYRAHRISAQERHDLEVALTEEIEAEVLKRFDEEHAGLVAGTADYAKAMKARQALVEKFGRDVAEANRQLTQTEAKQWTTLGASMRSSIIGALNGMLFQGQTFGQGMLSIAGGVLQAFATMGENMLADWIETQIAQLFETEVIQSSKGAAQVASNAAVAASGAYAATAAIPYIGPAIAPAAAATAYAGAMSWGALVGLDVGAWDIPKAQPFMLHPGEMVIPKPFAEAIRSGNGSGAQTQIIIQAIDTQTGAEFLDRNAARIARKIAGHWQDNPSSRPQF